jgi:hypothetical protein
MKIDEETLRTILKAAMQLERPTASTISLATGICECCVQRCMCAAESLGFVEYVKEPEFGDVGVVHERAADLGGLAWSITPKTVAEFCYANDESLTDEEMEELFTILHEQFDQYEILVEAIHCLRSGNDRYFIPASSPATDMAQVI